MGIKSDSEILQSLAAHRSAQAGEGTPPSEPVEGVGEPIESDEDADESEEVEDDDQEDDEEDDTEEDEDEDGEADEESEEEDDDETDEEDGDEDEESEDEDDATDADAEIARIQEAEKAAKQRINELLEEAKAKDAEAAEKLAEAEKKLAQVEKSGKRMKSAPIAHAKSMGIESPQDYMAIGAAYYQYGKGMAPDAKPEHRQRAESLERETEQMSEVDQIKAELEAMKADKAEAEKRAKEEAEQKAKEEKAMKAAADYTEEVSAKVSSAYPIAASILKGEDRDIAQGVVIDAALKLHAELGRNPTHKEIHAEIERKEREHIKRLGRDPDELFPRKKTKTKTGNASKEKKAPSKKKKRRDSTGTSKPKTDDEILAALKKRREEAAAG